MMFYRGYRKIRGIIKSGIFKLIYLSKIKGPIFSMGRAGEILLIGKESCLRNGTNVVLRNNVSLRLTNGEIYIGNNTFINDNCCIVSREKIIIGNDCLIGQNVCIYDNNHKFKGKLNVNKQGFISSEINIGNNVWIGSNVVILPGVKIGSNSVIGAGAIVSKNVPDNSIFYSKSAGSLISISR
jgi:acetyltransferase-like isoleucine patch superfamily enzyme